MSTMELIPGKIVGKRIARVTGSPLDNHQRALKLQVCAERLNPFPKPRGFVFKAKTWKEYEAWRKDQSNPRLW